MALEKKTEWVIERSFDNQKSRHSMNGAVSVFHCHHYATLYCQLADDAVMVDAKALLRKAVEYAILPVLSNYFTKNGVTSLDERIALAEEYFRIVGLGKLHFERVGAMSAVAKLERSHVDEGWVKKWGKREKPVNFIGQGYIAAALEAVFGLPSGSFTVNETQSIVSGADESLFNAVRA